MRRRLESKGQEQAVCRLRPAILAQSLKRCDGNSHKKESKDKDGYFEAGMHQSTAFQIIPTLISLSTKWRLRG